MHEPLRDEAKGNATAGIHTSLDMSFSSDTQRRLRTALMVVTTSSGASRKANSPAG